MLYIKSTKDYLEYFSNKENLSMFFMKVIYNLKSIFGKITKINSKYGELWLVPSTNEKFKKAILKNLKIYHINTVVLSNNMKFLKEEIKELGIKVLDGKWLYRYLIIDICKYICINKEQDLSEQAISIFVNKVQDIDFENIKRLSTQVKSLNIITKNDYKFKRLEESLLDEYGVILTTAYNYNKSLLKSSIIINIDCNEEEFNKFDFPRKATLINLDRISILKKGFNGINILNYKIEFPEKYIDSYINTDEFNKEILYESIIYSKTLPKNILNRIKQDGIELLSLQGKSGLINKQEFHKV